MAGSAALKLADQKKQISTWVNVTQCFHCLIHYVWLISTTHESHAVYVPRIKLELLTAVGQSLTAIIYRLYIIYHLTKKSLFKHNRRHQGVFHICFFNGNITDRILKKNVTEIIFSTLLITLNLCGDSWNIDDWWFMMVIATYIWRGNWWATGMNYNPPWAHQQMGWQVFLCAWLCTQLIILQAV